MLLGGCILEMPFSFKTLLKYSLWFESKSLLDGKAFPPAQTMISTLLSGLNPRSEDEPGSDEVVLLLQATGDISGVSALCAGLSVQQNEVRLLSIGRLSFRIYL